jgi:hypothetical protein
MDETRLPGVRFFLSCASPTGLTHYVFTYNIKKHNIFIYINEASKMKSNIKPVQPRGFVAFIPKKGKALACPFSLSKPAQGRSPQDSQRLVLRTQNATLPHKKQGFTF